jgi:hypothetical protein
MTRPSRPLHEAPIKGRYIGDFERFIGFFAPHLGWTPALHQATARALMEMIVWMGMHRHGDALPPPVDDETAFAATRGIVEAALRLPAGG